MENGAPWHVNPTSIFPSGLSLLILAISLSFAGGVLAGGDFGPETCMEGFVWREACGSTDRVCVKPDVRKDAQLDNAAAASRVSKVDKTYGPDTCEPGFVWREACGPNDHVCVTLEVRGQAMNDNSERQRRLKYPYCSEYAKDAVNAQQLNQLYRCSLDGNRWQSSESDHFSWCLNSADRDIGGERYARYKELERCNSRAGELARAGKSFPDSGRPSNDPNRCCWLPRSTAQGTDLERTCGPQCP